MNKKEERFLWITTLLTTKEANPSLRKGYIRVISNNPDLGTSNFFIESSYKQAGNGKENPCYLLTKQGCEMVANKMTGEKC